MREICALMSEVVRSLPPLRRLPLVTLYLSERCNSRCVTCDYWRHGRGDMSLAAVTALLPSLSALGTETVLISGGEPLLNREWAEIAALLKSHGLSLWLLTSGLSLAKHARRAAQLFDSITVSLDGTDPGTYASIRGVDAFGNVCEGIFAAVAAGASVSVRVTLQRANYAQLPTFVQLARHLGVRQISFLPCDVANPHAFGRETDFVADMALRPTDLEKFGHLLTAMERDYTEDFRSGFIRESPQKLRRILEYFTAVCGLGPYPPVRCNAPEFSAVVGADGSLKPCFFIPGPTGLRHEGDIAHALNSDGMTRLRSAISEQRREECGRCVCSMWRDLEHPGRLIPEVMEARQLQDVAGVVR
jgi:MoaA/NifB/PqqE/SkfB family radical SAM enzyme